MPSRLPPLDIKNEVNLAPHVVLLGAGASIAAYNDWGKTGSALPSMLNLIDILDLRGEITKAGYSVGAMNFEAFYDELASSGNNIGLQQKIENRVLNISLLYRSLISLPFTII